MYRTKIALLAVVLLISTCMLTGCATPQQAIANNQWAFTVVVNSVPSGAKVYGAGGGGAPGSLLGTTPLEITYAHLGGASLTATAPLEETLDHEYSMDMWGSCTTRAAYKCYVMMDGYLPYRIYEQVDNSHPVAFSSLHGGHREFTAYLQSQQPIVAAPPALQQNPQQQTKDGKVVVSCDIEGADVFVDGAFVGNSPSTLSLGEGTHTIEVKKEGHGAFKREMRVLAGSETSIRAQLSQ